jgi:hypothetical protein
MACVNSFGTELIFETEPHKAAAFYFGQDFLVHYPSENMVVVGNEFDI